MQAAVVGAPPAQHAPTAKPPLTTAALYKHLVGATGATGRELVAQLLSKPRDAVCRVTTIGRRRVEDVPADYGLDLRAAEAEGRLVQKARTHARSIVCCNGRAPTRCVPRGGAPGRRLGGRGAKRGREASSKEKRALVRRRAGG